MDGDRDPDDVAGSDPLLAVVAAPERGRRHLPYLLGLLDEDDPEQRLRGALAVCLVVEHDPDLLDAVVPRLVDRLDGDPPVAVPHALDYLAARRPRDVDAVVSDLADERELRAREHLYQSGAGFAGNDYGPRNPPANSVTDSQTDADDGDPPSVYTDRELPVADDDAERGVGPAGEGADENADVSAATTGDEARADEPGDEGRGDDRDGLTRGTLSLVADRLSAVVERSRFDDLNVLTERRRERFGDRYRAVAVDGETERPVTLSVYRVPEAATADDGAEFARSFRDAMDAWAGVDGHDGIRTVHDWAVRPRPWAALEYTGSTVADLETLPLANAVATGVEVADAVAHAHQHGVVHGAVDPETVAFPGATLAEDERQPPRLSAVGLARVYAQYQSLARFLDPRFAAPEHYTDRFGRVDHATDVYGVGALVYRLATGEPPYDGRPEEIRAGILADRTPVPSEVDPDLPETLDRVVGKALAREKLTRYETVNNLRRELRGVTDGR